MRNICARFSPNAQYLHKIVLLSPMHNICARLYFFPQCARFAQDCSYFSNAQYMRKIVLIFSMRNICARFAQDCTSFSNAQYMRKICTRLYLFPQCTIYAQDLRKIVLISSMRNNWGSLRKIVLLSPMRNICARFAQDCSYFSNAQYMHKICAILYLTSNLKW